MSLLIVFFALGIILLALEVVTPGPLCGITGCICMVLGVVNAFGTFVPLGGALAIVLALAALATVIYLEFVWLPRSRLAKRFTIDTTLHATSQPLPALLAELARLGGSTGWPVRMDAAAAWMAFSIEGYPAQRHSVSLRAMRMSLLEGSGFFCSRA